MPSVRRTDSAPASFLPEPGVLGAVALGGMVGAAARWWVAEAMAGLGSDFPMATLVENLLGSFLLGLAASLLADQPRHHLLTPFLTTGLLGAFTTMSAFHLETVMLASGGHVAPALGYAVGGLVAGVACAAAGLALGRTWADRSKGHR